MAKRPQKKRKAPGKNTSNGEDTKVETVDGEPIDSTGDEDEEEMDATADDLAEADTAFGVTMYCCPVALTDAEMAERGLRLAHLTTKVAELRTAKREEASIWTGKIKEEDKAIAELAAVMETGKEMRDCAVKEVIDAPNKAVKLVRIDTGETVFERPATERDLQIPLIPEEARGDVRPDA